jgi:nanoRNase/pAp phosphatase (c-di-AMP/oligoRNAs hydrolase)
MQRQVRPSAKTRAKLQKLHDTLRGRQSLLIVLQDFPDPDALASAVALRQVAHAASEINCSFVHGGAVGRAENAALANYLGINLRRPDEVEFGAYDAIAMVDTQPGTGNNSLPAGVIPQVVIDHHPLRKASRSVAFTDIRGNLGATSTILCQYLIAAGIEPEPSLATALLYGIRTDTQDLGRAARRADIQAYQYLYLRANLRMLAQMQYGALPSEYYQLLYEALHNAVVYGKCIYANIGRIENADMMGEVADILVRRHGAEWCLCVGIVDGVMRASLRTRLAEVDAGKTMRRMLEGHGTGGGHQRIAGGQLPLADDNPRHTARLERLLISRFQKAVGQTPVSPERLVREPRD